MVLWKCYESVMKVLWKCYESVMKVLWKCYESDDFTTLYFA